MFEPGMAHIREIAPGTWERDAVRLMALGTSIYPSHSAVSAIDTEGGSYRLHS